MFNAVLKSSSKKRNEELEQKIDQTIRFINKAKELINSDIRLGIRYLIMANNLYNHLEDSKGFFPEVSHPLNSVNMLYGPVYMDLLEKELIDKKRKNYLKKRR